MSRCFVSGADGFIGSHLCEALRDAGHEVTGMALYNATDSVGWLEEVEGVESVHGDVRDRGLLDVIFYAERPEYVFHLAAMNDVPYSLLASSSYFQTNTIGTQNVCEAASHIQAKLIHTSTSEVYGTAQYTPQDEAHPLCAQSLYAASKAAADKIVEGYWYALAESGFRVVTLRPFNAYGPRQGRRAVIGKIMRAVSAGQAVTLGNVDTERDFTYVTDTVAAFLAVMDLEGGVYNCGTGKKTKIREIASLAVERQTFLTDDSLRRPDSSEVQVLQCNFSKLNRATGWAPKVSLEEGLALTREWHDTRRRA